jgi:2-polyprenyl-6-methoxyphenol hydroxylase-like FAD-dependent oxidoreductase
MSSPSSASPPTRPKIVIVGGGFGGLTLGLLLEKAGVPYVILERAMAIKPLGKRDAVSFLQSENLISGHNYLS